MNNHLFANNVIPRWLLEVNPRRSPLTFRDLIALRAGHDFLLQVSNQMCAETVFGSLRLPWVMGRLDAQAVSTLRNNGVSFTSTALQQAVSAPLGARVAAEEILLLFKPHDVQFDAVDRCRVRFRVTVALGSSVALPEAPELSHTPALGEDIQRVVNFERVVDPVSRNVQNLLTAGKALTLQPSMMRTLSHIRPEIMVNNVALEIDQSLGFSELNRHIHLGNRTTFAVSAWLGSGLLEIPASFAAIGDQPSKTIRVAADVRQSTPTFTNLTQDAALLLSEADPLGLAFTITHRVRQRSSVALVEDVSLVGGPTNANAGHLGPLEADTFPCGTGPCPLNIGATVVPGRVAARSATEFIGSSRYGVVWSADAVRLLVRYCWETGAYPRSITQTQPSAVRLSVGGVEQSGDAISIFRLDTLDIIELEYDSNGRRDILYTRGSARVVPQFIRLQDGRELLPKDADEALFAPSNPMPWAALGELIEESISESSPDLLLFQRMVTRGVTSRLGRPFTEPPFDAVVIDSRLSAPAQSVALLVNLSKEN